MRTLCLLLVSAGALLVPAPSNSQAKFPFAGRWDLTIKASTESYPSWLEISGDAANPQVRIGGRVASVHPAENVKLANKRLTFSSSEYFKGQIPVTWEIAVYGRRLVGTQKRSDGVTGHVSGAPAPALDRIAPARWSEPETLFDGHDLKGWIPSDASKNHWKAVNGELVNEAAGANIRTVRKFQDFRLHIEYNCPPDGNSGVYLRGRYEVQVEYEPTEKNDKFHSMGAVYGFVPASVPVPPRPGQWESYDITLVGRRVTIVRNDIKTIDNVEIPGITGGALDSREAEPGPLYIQGDHTGGMKYRNIKISIPQP